MIVLCPHCGSSLPNAVIRGISSCNNCFRVFESNLLNQVLSASWLVRRRHILSKEQLQQYGYADAVSDVVMEYVVEGGYGHQELIEVLKDKVLEDYEVRLDLAS